MFVTVSLAMALVACNVGVRAPRRSSQHVHSYADPKNIAAQAENCFGTWLFTYALGSSGSGPASNSVSLFWGSFTAGRLLAIPVSAVVAPGAILLGSLPLAVLGPCIILLGARAGAVALLYAGAMAAGLGISTGATSICIVTRHQRPKSVTTLTLGIPRQVSQTACRCWRATCHQQEQCRRPSRLQPRWGP